MKNIALSALIILTLGLVTCTSSLVYHMEIDDKNQIYFYREDNARLLTSEVYIDANKDGKIDGIRALYRKQEAVFWLMAYYRLGTERLVIKQKGFVEVPMGNIWDMSYRRYRRPEQSVYIPKLPAFHLSYDMEKDGIWDFAIVDENRDGNMERIFCGYRDCDSLITYYYDLLKQ